MRDFTLTVYKQLLQTLLESGYSFQTVEEFIQKPVDTKTAVLRHDIDKLPENALSIAKIENSNDIRSSYYFRALMPVFNTTIIKKIVELDHEFGYHYEDLSLSRGNYEIAIKHFETTLNQFKKLYPVKTICMHGSPLSKWDNKDIWEKFDYRNFDIIAEPYFDIDFNKVFYMTDTGRRWDGNGFSVRDKVDTNKKINNRLSFRSTMDIISAAKHGLLPDKIMITTHPQRWDDKFLPWARELVWQNVKNTVKKWIYVK